MKLLNKNILITGASSGFGHGVAQTLAARGNKVAIVARRKERLDALVKEIEDAGGTALALPVDGTDTEASLAAVQAAVEAFGHIDAALLNAGGGKATRMATAKTEWVLGAMRTNFDTLVNFLCPLIEHMQSKGGLIAYTGSPSGYFGLPKSGPYSASKAAGRVLIDSCRLEQKRMNIRFTALYPGFTLTDSLDPKEVPIQSLIITKERAVREIIWAMEREKAHHMFPKRIRYLMMLARLMPEPLRRRIFAGAA